LPIMAFLGKRGNGEQGTGRDERGRVKRERVKGAIVGVDLALTLGLLGNDNYFGERGTGRDERGNGE